MLCLNCGLNAPGKFCQACGAPVSAISKEFDIVSRSEKTIAVYNRACPQCGNIVQAIARKCKYCSITLIPQKVTLGIAMTQFGDAFKELKRSFNERPMTPEQLFESASDLNSRFVVILGELENIDANPAKHWNQQPEVKELPNLLNANEKILHAITGRFERQHLGLMVATDARLLFVSKTMMKLVFEEISIHKISVIQYETGIAFGGMKISTANNTVVFDLAPKINIESFIKTVKLLMGQSKPTQSTSANGSIVSELAPVNNEEQKTESDLDQLEKLGKLFKDGILNDEEFQAKKRQILGSINTKPSVSHGE